MVNSSPRFDTLVVGAGAAGLAAAAELAAHGRSVCVIEARNRLGGRVHTRHEAGLPVPIELGAEFIHGRSRITLDWLAKTNQPLIDASQTRWMSVGGKLQQSDDLFDEMKEGLSRVKRPSRDLPFAEFLEGKARKHLSERAREFARALVEGFDAADATRVSTLRTLEEWSSNGAADAPTFRPLGGYGALIGAIAGALPTDTVKLQLNSIVAEVQWSQGAVCIAGTQLGEPFRLQASQAIITLPLGVLQRAPHAPGSVLFTPTLTQKQRALTQLAAGPVIKVILKFRRAFWEELDKHRYSDGAFFHNPQATFPTFWSALPTRTSLLVAWAAGPNATRCSGSGSDAIVRSALESLESIFGKRAKIREQLAASYLHDWQADCYACGAYSYVLAGGAGARRSLAEPLRDTLYFAGEATDTQGEPATVAGALQSGQRAARETLQRSSRKRSPHKRVKARSRSR